MQFYFEVHFSEILNENLAQMFESLLCVCVCVCVFFLWGGCCGKGLLPILSLFSVSKQVLRCYKKTKLFVKASGYRKNVLQYSNLGNVGSEPTLLDVVLLRCSSDTDAAMQSF